VFYRAEDLIDSFDLEKDLRNYLRPEPFEGLILRNVLAIPAIAWSGIRGCLMPGYVPSLIMSYFRQTVGARICNITFNKFKPATNLRNLHDVNLFHKFSLLAAHGK